jgi:hypothetical protein
MVANVGMIVFVHRAELVRDTLTRRTEFMFNENGEPALARWVDVHAFKDRTEQLFPEGLLHHL